MPAFTDYRTSYLLGYHQALTQMDAMGQEASLIKIEKLSVLKIVGYNLITFIFQPVYRSLSLFPAPGSSNFSPSCKQKAADSSLVCLGVFRTWLFGYCKQRTVTKHSGRIGLFTSSTSQKEQGRAGRLCWKGQTSYYSIRGHWVSSTFVCIAV